MMMRERLEPDSPVSQEQFHRSLSLIWFYIALTLLGAFGSDWTTVLLGIVAIFMFINLTLRVWNLQRKRRSTNALGNG